MSPTKVWLTMSAIFVLFAGTFLSACSKREEPQLPPPVVFEIPPERPMPFPAATASTPPPAPAPAAEPSKTDLDGTEPD